MCVIHTEKEKKILMQKNEKFLCSSPHAKDQNGRIEKKTEREKSNTQDE